MMANSRQPFLERRRANPRAVFSALWLTDMRTLITGAILVGVTATMAFGQSSLRLNVPDWVQVAEQALWQPRDSQGEIVYNNQLWILGGWFHSYEAPPRDVWTSPDGASWKRVTQRAPWKHSDLSMALAFQGKMWFMGGWYNGRLKGHSASNQVWWSTEGENWRQVPSPAGWTPRIAATAVVFQGKMWILGGTENYYFGDNQSLKNDVWVSSDGLCWECMTAEAEWAPRAYHQAAVLNNCIYLFGGGNYVPNYEALNDVWSSDDGIHWIYETDLAPTLWFSSVIYRNRMWVLGGWSNHPATNWGDVWVSRDGKQ